VRLIERVEMGSGGSTAIGGVAKLVYMDSMLPCKNFHIIYPITIKPPSYLELNP